VLRVNVKVSSADFTNDPNKYALIELSANLIDTTTRDILLPFSFNDREGHPTISVAENRVFISAENRIEKEFKDVFSVFLSQLQPMR